jgi:rRNA maturation RNase YbeY
MISFSSQNEFELEDSTSKKQWIEAVVSDQKLNLGELSFVFCSDEFLHKINLEYLNHDTLTDVISFDYSKNGVIEGEIYISTERVSDNANDLSLQFLDELDRVIIHGVLHFCGLGDKTIEEKEIMRGLEDKYLAVR